MTKIAVFVGSLRSKSYNQMLAKALEGMAKENVEFNYIDINMPLFNQDLEENYPIEAQRAKDIVEAADGVLFITPEYNRSVPGVLKNAVDWISRPWGYNSFAGKPTGIVGASASSVGSALAQYNLRSIVTYLDAVLMGQPEVMVANASTVFGTDGEVIDERWDKNLQSYVDAFVAWVEDQK